MDFMTATASDPTSTSSLFKGAVMSGMINAVINGAIQDFIRRGSGPMPLTNAGPGLRHARYFTEKRRLYSPAVVPQMDLNKRLKAAVSV